MEINKLKYLNKKTIELKCCVCGGKAFGFNFNQITCESCKAFFRRNAFKSEVKNKMKEIFFSLNKNKENIELFSI